MTTEIGAFIHAQTEDTSPAAGDEVLTYDLTASAVKRVKFSNFPTGDAGTPNDGWINAPDSSWVYASASTITVDAGAAAIYSVGDKIRLKQGGAYKYFYIIAVADTLLTVTGGDVTVANAGITDNYYSKVASPLGFPRVMVWTCTETGWAAGFTQDIVFSIDGNLLTIIFVISGTSDNTATSFSLPVTAVAPQAEGALGLAKNNGSYKTTASRMCTNGANIDCYTDSASAAWAASNGKEVRGVITYRI
jgi:hypothetical protein